MNLIIMRRFCFIDYLLEQTVGKTTSHQAHR